MAKKFELISGTPHRVSCIQQKYSTKSHYDKLSRDFVFHSSDLSHIEPFT